MNDEYHTRVINFFYIHNVHNCSYRRPYTTKHVYRYFLFPPNTGYDVFNSITRWHPDSHGYPACIWDPATIWDPASIKSFMVMV